MTPAQAEPTRVTVEMVFRAIAASSLKEFSTFDIAERMDVTEYPVRAAMSWLLKSNEIKKYRTVKRYTAAAHEPYWATTYQLVEKCEPVDFSVLNRLFGYGR